MLRLNMVRLRTLGSALILGSFIFTTLAFAKTGDNKTIEIFPSGFAISQRASDLGIEEFAMRPEEIHEPGPSPLRNKALNEPTIQEDPVLQKEVKPLVSAATGVSFSGIPSPGYVPSDSNLAVGPNDILEVVNVQFAVYSKSGTTLAGPTNIQSLFSPLSGDCSTGTYGDPIALYDRQADRWVLSMIGRGSTTLSECIAVSQTNNPAGSYYLYGYSFGTNLNDYPKLSTWATTTNSAYLATFNIFAGGSNFTGADLCGMDRTKALAGNASAAMLCKETPGTEGSYLPADMDGPTPPVDGTPGLYISWYNNNPGQLYLRKLTLNFSAGTATLAAPTVISVANDTLACGGGTCVPEEGTTQELDSLGDRLMYRFAVRHFSDHDRAVVNHAVTSGSTVGIRWYELYDPAGSVTLNQQGTFAPDSTYRWMASLAEDQMGDIGLGYSVSSASIFPGISFTGRVPTDTPGTMESEVGLVAGTGAQDNGISRWGDYTAMQVDPSDDCTFWYVDQYQAVTGSFDWSTNISSFIFNGCSTAPNFTLSSNPSSLQIQQGASGTSTITVVPVNGFVGDVTLSAKTSPSGLASVGFSTNPTTATSTLTVSAGSSTPLGVYMVTVAGSTGILTSQTIVPVTVTGAPSVSLSAAALTWGNEVVGGTAAGKSFTISNVGAGTLNISSIVPSGDFAIGSTTCGSTLAVNKSCTVKLTFTPTQLGIRAGAITITDNAANSPQSVSLSGTGTVQAMLSPANATWLAVKVGSNGAAKVFTLSNKQSVALTGISISTTGDFSISTTTCSSSLAAKTGCTISVIFSPTQTGARTGTLQVADNTVTSPQVSHLTGTGK